MAGGNNTNYIAAWDDSIWHSTGSGLNTRVLTLSVYNGQIIAGGQFTAAGENVSYYWARWGVPTPIEGIESRLCC